MKPLTQKQRSFVLNYISNGLNARQAALTAGYSDNVALIKGSKMTNHPLIRNEIEKAYNTIDRQRAELMLAVDERVRILSAIIYDIVPKDGSEPKREYYKDALKAIAELNKMSGDYAPDKRLSVTVDATKNKIRDVKRLYKEY